MKKRFPFELENSNSVSEKFANGLKGIAMASDDIGRVHTTWCQLLDGSLIKIQSEMNDIDGWHEIGCLELSIGHHEASVPQITLLSNDWNNISTIEKLCHDSAQCYAESGIVITNSIGQSIIIVCDANPYLLSIQAPFFSGEFLPEYELKSYTRTVFND